MCPRRFEPLVACPGAGECANLGSRCWLPAPEQVNGASSHDAAMQRRRGCGSKLRGLRSGRGLGAPHFRSFASGAGATFGRAKARWSGRILLTASPSVVPSWPPGGARGTVATCSGAGDCFRAHPATCSRAGEGGRSRLEPLSPTRLRVEFTARAELYEKLERSRELLSHAVPSGDLGDLFERALDALIEQESRKRFGAGKPRKARELKAGSRHVPVEIERAVWERDQGQCTFVDSEGHRCAERRFLTIEHRTPHARKGPPTLENLCLLCSAHNLENARQVFGEPHIEAKIRARTPPTSVGATETKPAERQPLEIAGKVLSSLSSLGFPRSEASAALGQALGSEPGLDVELLLRKCLLLLVPKAS
jgi:hypothetical protein